MLNSYGWFCLESLFLFFVIVFILLNLTCHCTNIFMKKILIFHPYLAPYRIDLYNRLASSFKIKVLLLANDKERRTLGFNLEYINGLAQFPFSYYDKGFYFGRHLVSSIYYKTIKAFRPDVVFAHELGINTLIAIFLKFFFNYRIIVTIDDSPAMIVRYNKVRSLLRDFVVKRVDAMLVVHPEVKSFMELKYKSFYHCRFLYFPIIQDEVNLRRKMVHAESKALEILKEYNLELKKIILFVGRFEAVKCPDVLIKVYEKIGLSGCCLVLVGDGSLKDQLKEYIKLHNLDSSVLLPGKLSGELLYAWYRIAHVLVLPSKFEPFGAVVNEALVAGCQVLVSDMVGANSLVDNKNGIIFESENEHDLTKNLKFILESVKCLPFPFIRENNMRITFFELMEQLKNFILDDENRIF